MEIRMSFSRVLVDLDGVLSDFERMVKEVISEEGREGISKKRLWSGIQDYNDNVAPWFGSLPLCEGAIELWNYLTKNYENVQILTATGYTPKDAAKQKKDWVEKHFGEGIVVNCVTTSADKATFARNRYDLLIDDRKQSTEPFRKAGGSVILHKDSTTTIAEIIKLKKLL